MLDMERLGEGWAVMTDYHWRRRLPRAVEARHPETGLPMVKVSRPTRCEYLWALVSETFWGVFEKFDRWLY